MISQVAFLGSRSSVQCQYRWHKVLRPGLVKAAWTKEEDVKLREAVDAHGAKNKPKGQPKDQPKGGGRKRKRSEPAPQQTTPSSSSSPFSPAFSSPCSSSVESLDSCAICFEPLCPITTEIGHLACVHTFHVHCLDPLAHASAGPSTSSRRGVLINCPLCRKRCRYLPPPPPEEEDE